MTGIIDTANTVIDTAQAIARNPIIRMIGNFFPQVRPLLEAAERYAPVIDAAQPAIAEAMKAGEPVFKAAVAAAPKLIDLAKDVIAKLPAQTAETRAAIRVAIQSNNIDVIAKVPAFENFAREVGGFGRMTHEQEMKWMNDMTPGNDPSQENSKYTIG